MALLQRIFSSKRAPRTFSNDGNARKSDPTQKTVPPKLDKSNIRLVIYAETDRGRTPYFDSNAITCIEEIDKNVIKIAPKAMRAKGLNYLGQRESSLPQHRTPSKYHFQKLGNDVKVLEEMMFGTVAMAFRGLTLKVHLLRSPPQLMVSKVFIPEKPTNRDGAVDAESDNNSLHGSSADFSSGEFYLPVQKPKERYSKEFNGKYVSKSIPVDVPTKEFVSDYSTDDDNGLASFTSSGSLRTSFPSPSNSSMSSYSSLHRRWMRAQTTSLDGHHRTENNMTPVNSLTRPQRNKLAVGIIFGSHDEKDEESNKLFQSFFFSHFALIEGHVEKLRSVIEKAYFNARNFLPSIMEALEIFRNDIFDLYMAPRLAEPVWLTMMSTTSYKTKLCEKFMETFVYLVTKYDNKNCKFFVSTLLSAVLTQHLAWVATVTPAGGTPTHTYLDKHTAKWVDALAKTHPYNPLWAQLGDLYGAIGLPLKISRTVVVGKKADIVKRFLYILSYFIRCSEVQENSDLQCLSNIVNDTQFELSMSPTLSEKTLIDGLDRSTSPVGANPFFTRQNSSNNGGSSSLLTSHKLGIVDSCWGKTKYKLDAPAEEDGNDHFTRIQSEPVIPNNSSKVHNSCCFERSDSGYNGANFESSCEQETKGIHSKCADNKELVGKTALEINKCDIKVNSVPSDANNMCCKCELHPHLNHVHSDSIILPKPHIDETKQLVDIANSPVKSQIPAVSSNPAGEPTGMSELFIYEPNPFPVSCIATAKVIESPRIERVMLAGKSAAAQTTQHISDYVKVPAELVIRSQSFSEGKIRSRLTQQLDEGVDDITDGEYKLLTSSVGSGSSWLSNESKKETDLNKPIISRQTSQDSKLQVRPSTLSKNSSITPTELSRRRHLSSTSSIDYEAFDPMVHCKEIKIPNSLTESGQWHIKAFDRNFGHSLLANYTDHYMSDFVLHGTSDTNFKPRLLNDLQMAVRNSVLDEPIDEAVCVIADTDNWTVEVASSKVMGMSPSGCTPWTSSQLVADLIESVVEISRLKMSSEFCLMHLEDRLQEIYFKSMMLSENLRATTTYSQRELTAMLGFESSDMPLLQAIAGTLTPSHLHGTQ